MNENINLCKILKDCPKGTELFSYAHGKVTFIGIDHKKNPYPIKVFKNGSYYYFGNDGRQNTAFMGICILVPSLEDPDWSKWKFPKPKFDPKTLKPFDRVLEKSIIGSWTCDNFSHIDCNGNLICIGHSFVRAIPYNDETKHLVGTSDEAPEYYRYWED